MPLVQVRRTLIYQGDKEAIDRTLQQSAIQLTDTKDFGKVRIYEETRIEQQLDIPEVIELFNQKEKVK